MFLRSLPVLILLLFPFTTAIIIFDANELESPRKTYHLLANSEGPTFTFMMPNFADLIPGTEPVDVSLDLTVKVTDPDGVDTVIGSYSNRSESIWKNVTLHKDLISGISNSYKGHACDYTLNKEHYGVIWDIKFYANDTLGNWNVSETTFLSVFRPNLPPPSESTYQENLLIFQIMVIVAIFAMGIVATWVVFQKKVKRRFS